MVWSRKSLERVLTISCRNAARLSNLKVRGGFLVGSTNNSEFCVWDLRSGQVVKTLTSQSGTITDIQTSQSFLVTLSTAHPPNIGTFLASWDFSSPRTTKFNDSIQISTDASSGCVKMDENYVIVASSERPVEVYGTSSLLKMKQINGIDLKEGSFCLHYEYPSVIVCSRQTICVFNVETGKIIRTLRNLASGHSADNFVNLRCNNFVFMLCVVEFSWDAIEMTRIDFSDILNGTEVGTLELANWFDKIEADDFSILGYAEFYPEEEGERVTRSMSNKILIWDFLQTSTDIEEATEMKLQQRRS